MWRNWTWLNRTFVFSAAVVLFAPLPALYWIPAGEVIGHGLIYPWPSTDAMLVATWYSLFSWMHGPNWEFSSALFNLYAYLSLSVLNDPSLAQSVLLYTGLVLCISGVVVLSRAIGLPAHIGIFAGLFYIYSPFVMGGLPLAPLNIRVLPFYATTPWLLVAVRLVLVAHSQAKALAFLAILSVFVASPGYSTPQYLVLHLLLLIALSATNAFNAYDKTKSMQYWYRLLSACAVLVLANAWWLFPGIYHIDAVYSSRAEPGFSDGDILRGASGSILDILLLGISNYQVMTTLHSWMGYYRQPIYIICVFILAGCVMLAASRSDLKARIRPFLLTALVIIFIAKGVSPPFAIILDASFSTWPFLGRLFRNPTYFGSIYVFLFSFLFAFGVSHLALLISGMCKKLHSKCHVVLLYGCGFTIIMLYGWPFVTGGPASNSTVRVPQYFTDLVAFLNTREEVVARTIELPINAQQSHFVSLDWGRSRYTGFPPLAILTDYLSLLEAPEQDLIYRDEGEVAWLKTLGDRNVSYIVYYGDAVLAVSSHSQEILGNKARVAKALEWAKANNYIDEERTFGPIRLFHLASSLFSQRVVVESTTANTAQKMLRAGMQHSDVKYVAAMVNPTKYKIVATLPENEINIKLSEAFSREWKVYLECRKADPGSEYETMTERDGAIRLPSKRFDPMFFETWFRSPVSETSHHMTAAGGNAWLLDMREACTEQQAGPKDVVILLEYEPQKAVYVGYAISGLTLLILFFLFFGRVMSIDPSVLRRACKR